MYYRLRQYYWQNVIHLSSNRQFNIVGKYTERHISSIIDESMHKNFLSLGIDFAFLNKNAILKFIEGTTKQ